MEWTVVTVIIAVVGLFLTVGKPILNVCTEIKSLRMEVNWEKNEMDNTEKNIDKLLEISRNHEIRIHDLEIKSKEIEESVEDIK